MGSVVAPQRNTNTNHIPNLRIVSPQALIDLLAGQILVMFDSTSIGILGWQVVTALPQYIASGSVSH